ncbi:MAG: TIGR04552 family protein [Deltaproteobacteria bacterium]|nr:TIGR04552 family protein [Deltaproteobacteria bacterium]
MTSPAYPTGLSGGELGARGFPTDWASRLTLGDLEMIRLILRGSSIVDWPRFYFSSDDGVRRFLKVNELDLDDERDVERLWQLTRRAADYIERTFGIALERDVVHPDRITDLFFLASSRAGDVGLQQSACMLLKVVHIINHIDARELGFLYPLSDRELFQRLEERSIAKLTRLRDRGLPIVEVSGSRKLKDSLVTKLLSKRETLATQIFDKLRFRIVVESRDAVIPLLVGLTDEVFPFNYIVPGQSRNQIVDFGAFVRGHRSLAALGADLAEPLDSSGDPQGRLNEFSGTTYRDLNFVVDVPIAIPDDRVNRTVSSGPQGLGRITFVLVEFQLLDATTAAANERGDNSHDRYKARQLEQVARRLRCIPK